jgi:hypothetical protein
MISFRFQLIPLQDAGLLQPSDCSICTASLHDRIFFSFLPSFLRHNSFFFPLAFSVAKGIILSSRASSAASRSLGGSDSQPFFLMVFRSVFPACRISPLLPPPLRQSLDVPSSPEGLGRFRCLMFFFYNCPSFIIYLDVILKSNIFPTHPPSYLSHLFFIFFLVIFLFIFIFYFYFN